MTVKVTMQMETTQNDLNNQWENVLLFGDFKNFYQNIKSALAVIHKCIEKREN